MSIILPTQFLNPNFTRKCINYGKKQIQQNGINTKNANITFVNQICPFAIDIPILPKL